MQKNNIKNVNSDTVREIVDNILPKLTLLDWFLLHLKIENGYTLKKMSKLLGISYETIRLRLQNIYKLIRLSIEEEFKRGGDLE